MTRALVVLIVGATVASACTRVVRGDERDAVSGAEPIRVCADPNNLPFTNDRGEGFENKLADLLARDLGTRVQYTWHAHRRGFLRSTLTARACDLVMGLPKRVEMALTTKPYYRSSYVFVTRRASGLRITSFDDVRLKKLRIGVPMVADDGANAPPAHALARRGVVGNVVAYSVYGDYRVASPGSQLITAVARGEIDVAAAWGPVAGYFAARQREPLDLRAVQPHMDGPLPFVFDMSMAVRRGDTARKAMLDSFIDRRRSEIDAILAEFSIPRVDVAREGTF